jgi:hypothetical protein
MFGDQRADALDRAEQITEGLISHDKSLPVLSDTPDSPSSGASNTDLRLQRCYALLARRDGRPDL